MDYREFYIKKKNGKQRRICAPDAELLRYQRTLLNPLNNYFIQLEDDLFNDDVFHGFVRNRNCVTAALKHQGFAHTITLDISNCFDSIRFAAIPRLSTPASPVTVIAQQVTHKDGSLGQGFATSPILANLYLLNPIHELHQFMETQYLDFRLTVYADDIQISIPESTYEQMNTIIAAATSILAAYRLTVNTAKTRIRHRKYGNRKVLGIQVGDTTLNPNRKLKKKIRAARHQGNHCSLGGLVTCSRMLLPRALRPVE